MDDENREAYDGGDERDDVIRSLDVRLGRREQERNHNGDIVSPRQSPEEAFSVPSGEGLFRSSTSGIQSSSGNPSTYA